MSGARSRTGLRKRRSVQRELLEARWRERGGAVRSADERDRVLKIDVGADTAAACQGAARHLILLHALTGCESFAQTIRDLAALGVIDRGMVDLLAVRDLVPWEDTVEVAVTNRCRELRQEHPTISDQEMIEVATADVGVPAVSFEAAAKKSRAIVARNRQRRPPAGD